MKSDGGRLDWVLQKMEELEAQTPAKSQNQIKIADLADLEDWEEEDDVEYDPALDPTPLSDDEGDNSSIGTPGGHSRSGGGVGLYSGGASFHSPMSGSGKGSRLCLLAELAPSNYYL